MARQGIRIRLEKDADISVVGECDEGTAAVQCVNDARPDVVFLDVQMPGMNGFDVIRQIPQEQMPLIVFLTAYDQYAVKAFEVHAFDYLLKPIDDERFREVVRRVRRQLELVDKSNLDKRLEALLAEQLEFNASSRRRPDRFAIRSGTKISFVMADEIDWIEASDDYVSLHVGKRTHLLRETLNNLEQRLDPHNFVRIHRSTIIRADRLREIRVLPNRELRVTLGDGTELKVSRTYRDRLDRWLS
jgi:two-component system, LytTR family, response regulator